MIRIRKIYLSLIIIVLFLVNNLLAQDDYKSWLKKDRQQFKSFLAEEDKAFSDFLKKEWEPFNVKDGTVRDVKPKPVTPPVAEIKEKPEPVAKPAEPTAIIKKVPPPPPPKPVKKPEPRPDLPVRKQLLDFKFLNVPLQMDYTKIFDLNLPYPVTNQLISEAWESLASSDHKYMLDQLKEMRSRMLLNDWGYIQLIQSFAEKILPDSENERILLIWFVLNKSGYDTRAAYSKNTLYLLFPSSDLIFGNDFITVDGKKYYFLKTVSKSFKLDEKVFTYKKTYQNDSKVLSLHLKDIPLLSSDVQEKELKFTYNGKKLTIPVQYEKDVATYFMSYPQTELSVYFDAPLSRVANYSLLSGLRPYMQNYSEVEAVNFLLRFVQNAFAYQTDDQQFGKEKYLMPEETIFYPNSDCEDRSILFSFLVRELLGLQVVALDYPGHIATAVKFNTEIPGQNVIYDNKKFTVCDPTYVNADAGMCMPQYEKINPKVIQLF